MRKLHEKSGQVVIVKDGVGKSSFGQDMSGNKFMIEDWCDNVLGCSWSNANGNMAALEYAMRTGIFGSNNNVPLFSNDVVYGKIDGFGHLFHINELELD